MKGRKLWMGLIPLSVGMILAGCKTKTSESGNVTADPLPTSDTTSPATSDSHTSEASDVTHRNALNKNLADGAITRDYDERFDKEVEDFSGESILGTTTGTVHNPYLRVIVDSKLDSFPKTPGSGIFKMASATFDGDKTLLGQGAIHFRMRVAEGKLSLNDLIFGVRPSDDNDAHVYEINMHDALNADAEANPELTSEFQDISISLGDTIDDANTTFPDTTLKVLEQALGLHLYAKDGIDVSAVVEIEKVSFTKGDTETVIDDFARDGIGGNKNIYWGPTDSPDAILVRKGVLLSKDTSYTTTTLSEEQRALTHIVLAAQGDLSTSKMTVTYDDSASTKKTLEFKDLKAKSTNAVVNAVDGKYSNLAIDLSAFGAPEGTNVKTVTIENAGDNALEISNIFMTSFEEPELDKKYPTFNTETAVTFDDFNRTYNVGSFPSGGDGYTASTTEEQNIAAGINGITSWSNADQISMKDGSLNLPATENYDEVSIDSSHVMQGAQYLVFSIKGEEGYDLSSFRFAMDGKTTWFNAAHAMEGVMTYKDPAYESPYVTEDGYTWYVVDLSYEQIEAKGSIEIYYTGAKAIRLDSIFFANSFMAYDVETVTVENPEARDLSGYQYIGAVREYYKNDYFTFTAKGDGTATFNSLRVEYKGATLYMKDNAITILDSTGKSMKATDLIAEEYTKYYVDLSAFTGTESNGYIHFHAGALEGSTGTMTVSEYGTAKKGYATTANAGVSLNLTTEWSYVSGWTATYAAKTMFLHVSGDGTNDLSLFRIGHIHDGNTNEYWANAKPLLKNVDGTAFDYTTKIGKDGVDLVLDLEGAGMTVAVGDEIHFHINGVAAGTLQFGDAKAAAEEMPTSVILSSYDQNLVKKA